MGDGDGHKSQHGNQLGGEHGGWLVLGEPHSVLAHWNRRQGFDRHREVGRKSQCGECEYSDGTYGTMEAGAGDLPRDVITPLTLF